MMRRICFLLARLYPERWRARYGAEYEELLAAMRHPSAKDAAGMMLHCAGLWARGLWEPQVRAASIGAALVFVPGMMCVAAATLGSVQLWLSTSIFLVLATMAIPVAAVTGFVAGRRNAGTWRAAAMSSLSLMVPTCALWLVSQALASAAPAFPAARFADMRAYDPAQQRAIWDATMYSREFIFHWGRCALMFGFPCAAAAFGAAWLGARTALWRMRAAV